MKRYVIRKWVAGEIQPDAPMKTMYESHDFGKEEAFEEFREIANDLLADGCKIVYITHQQNYTFRKGRKEFDLYMYEEQV